MRTFLVSMIACWGCVAAGALWAEDRISSFDEGTQEQRTHGVGYSPSGLKSTLSRSERAYDRTSIERNSLSVEERTLRSREWRRVLKDAYSTDEVRRHGG